MQPRGGQQTAIDACWAALVERSNTILVAGTGAGKCLAFDEKVIMFDGTRRRVQDVRPGDLLMGPDSLPRRVESIARGREVMAKVDPVKGETHTFNLSHILSLRHTQTGEVVNISIEEYLKKSDKFKHLHKLYRSNAINFDRKKQKVPAYIMGVWLGDGKHGSALITSPDAEVVDAWKEYADSIGQKVTISDVNRCPSYEITKGMIGGKKNWLRDFFRKIEDKHIPYEYACGSIEQRLDLLAGIIDTDGHLSRGGCDIVVKQKEFAEGICYVARSLGMAAYKKKCVKHIRSRDFSGQYWRVYISGDCSIIPTRIARKKAPKRKQIKNVLNTGFMVEELPEGDYYGFEISGPDRLFLLGDFTVTHNTVMGSFVADEGLKKRGVKKILWLQHRDKLTSQNCETFRKISGLNTRVSIFDGNTKNISGDVVFGMVQTVANYAKHLPKFDMIVIDEAHHAPSSTYIKIVNAAREKNPDLLLFGMTATPVRSDKKTMRIMFDNVAHIIPIPELIANGELVPPRTFKPYIENLKESLSELKVLASGENDMDDVAEVIDRGVVNKEVVRQWKRLARDRKTIVFCANVNHCIHVAEEFSKAGVSVAMSHSKMKKAEREAQEQRFEDDKAQILVNVMIMTEGFDDQRIGCVIILRTCQAELTFLQIVGRGLRLLDKSKFPGWSKTDAIILDFATEHRSLEQDVDSALKERKKRKKAAPKLMKVCPTCLAAVPASSRTCAFCGHRFPAPADREAVETVEMREIDLLENSRFAWVDVFANGRVSLASGFDSYALAIKPWRDSEVWVAFARHKGSSLEFLGKGDRADALALANGWLRAADKSPKSRKGSRWMTDVPTPRQEWALAAWVGRWQKVGAMSKYAATCRINYMQIEDGLIAKVDELDIVA